MPNYHPVERSFFYGWNMDKHIQLISRKTAKRIGMTYYFTGSSCKWGHVSTRNVKNSACHECTAMRYKEWYKENSEGVCKASSERQKIHPERYKMIRKRGHEKYKRNKRDEYNSYMRSFNAARRALIYSGDSALMVSRWTCSKVKECFYCGNECKDKFHVDHLVPISKGGRHETRNLVIACPGCNMAKSDTLPLLFIAKNYGFYVSDRKYKFTLTGRSA